MPSSVIQIMFYDPQAGVVDVVFRARHVTYRYLGVSRADWEEFLAAPSKGTYLNQVFKARHRDVKLAVGGATTWILRWAQDDASKVGSGQHSRATPLKKARVWRRL